MIDMKSVIELMVCSQIVRNCCADACVLRVTLEGYLFSRPMKTGNHGHRITVAFRVSLSNKY